MKPNDYDGDKKADIVYLAGGTSGGAWMQVGNPTPLWAGLRTDVNVGGDYDNDGKWEPAELSGRDWYSSKLPAPIRYDPPGLPTAPADYDGDGRADLSLYNLHDGRWVVEGRGLVATLGANTFPVEYPRSLALSMPRLIANGSRLHDPAWATLYPGHCAGTP